MNASSRAGVKRATTTPYHTPALYKLHNYCTVSAGACMRGGITAIHARRPVRAPGLQIRDIGRWITIKIPRQCSCRPGCAACAHLVRLPPGCRPPRRAKLRGCPAPCPAPRGRAPDFATDPKSWIMYLPPGCRGGAISANGASVGRAQRIQEKMK